MNKVSLAKAILKTAVLAAACLGALTVIIAYPITIMFLLFSGIVYMSGFFLYKLTMYFYKDIEGKKTK